MRFSIILSILFLITFVSCQSNKSGNEETTGDEQTDQVVEVVARDFTFEVSGDILSGWNTFRFINKGHAEHFFLLTSLPDSISYQRYVQEVVRPFNMVFDSLKAGMSKADAGALLGSSLPAWYFTACAPMGGTGIVSTALTTQVTIKLEPGTYVMECYIKEKGQFHSALGMIRPVTVKETESAMQPPAANLEIELTDTTLTTTGQIGPGTNVVAVHFKEHPQYELGNDIHVIRLEEDTEMENVIAWLDWMNVMGLEKPAPVTFLGGTQEMPVGYTSYFSIDLEPGSYAWIAESGAYRGLLKEFSVGSEQ